MAATMKNAPVRYFAVEHVTVMIVAIALAHIGAARVRKAASDSARFQAATIFLGFALAAVAGFTPWGETALSVLVSSLLKTRRREDERGRRRD